MKDKDYWFATKPKVKPLKREYTPIRKRKRKSYEYEEARILVREECIQSSNEYKHWWDLNKPYKMPKTPWRAYKSVWTGWGDFLGVYNEYPIKRRIYKKYEDAKRFMHKQKLRNYDDWRNFCKDKKRPEDIPSNPQVVYRRSREWVGWKDFLGYTIMDRIETIRASVPLLYIMKDVELPNNVYRIGVNVGTVSEVIDISKTNNLRLLGVYLLPATFNWREFLDTSFERYTYGESNDYTLSSFSNLLFYLDTEFDKIACSAS